MRKLGRGILVFSLVIVFRPSPGWTWGNDGHQIVARIAAMNLSPNARRHVARILKTSPEVKALANSMAEAAVWPDMVLKELDSDTKPWHFLDICRDDAKNSVGQGCRQSGCVTAKIEEYRRRLRSRKYDRWGSKGDLSLLLHLVGDIHQPLHCADNADRGGNCVRIQSRNAIDLHGFWDNEVVTEIEEQLGTGTDGAARRLNLQPTHDNFSWRTGNVKDIAWESHQLALDRIYLRLSIPKQSCVTGLVSCDAAPSDVRNLNIQIDSNYRAEAASIARLQLARGGIRLAQLLNAIWP